MTTCQRMFLLVRLDVITIEKTGEHFRLIYDIKGRFCVHRITAEEAKVSSTAAIDISDDRYAFI